MDKPRIINREGRAPQRDTELDDEIEQILGLYIPDALWRIDARNAICAAIAARGYDVFARPKAPGPVVRAVGRPFAGNLASAMQEYEQPCHVSGVSPWRTDTRRYRCGHIVDDEPFLVLVYRRV